MTYHGGIEDGKSMTGARILRIIRDSTLTPQDKLDEIEQYCLQIVDDDTRRWALSGQPIAQVMPKHHVWNPDDGAPISAWSPTPDEL